jgi:hypothetical protein
LVCSILIGQPIFAKATALQKKLPVNAKKITCKASDDKSMIGLDLSTFPFLTAFNRSLPRHQRRPERLPAYWSRYDSLGATSRDVLEWQFWKCLVSDRHILEQDHRYKTTT